MKILYYTDQTYLHGGIERVLANKINYLVEQDDVEVYLVTTEQKGNTHCYPISDKLHHHDLGINYHRRLSYFHPKNVIKVVQHFFKLNAILDKLNPDIVITPHFDYAFYFLPFLHKRSKKIKEYHGSRYFESTKRYQSQSFRKNKMYALQDYIQSKYSRIVVLTPDEKKHFISNNTVVIPNGIDLRANKTALLTSKKMITAGRIAPVKGYNKLIESWKKVQLHYPIWKLEIYGSGEEDYISGLKQQIENLGLNEVICLCGQTDQMTQKMLEASAYIMSSTTECFPMVLLEAQSVGLPIISFDCPYGPKNIISNKQDGLLVDNQNSDKLADAIIQLIESKEMRKQMGIAAKENVKRLDQVLIMQKWKELFNEIKEQ